MAGMHAEVTEYTDLTARAAEALPVRRLRRVEIAATMETGYHLQHAAELGGLHRLHHPLRAGEERELRAPSFEAARPLNRRGDVARAGQIHPERLFGEKV